MESVYYKYSKWTIRRIRDKFLRIVDRCAETFQGFNGHQGTKNDNFI